MPKLRQRKGLTSAHLLESQPMAGTQTTEQKIRGGDATADWVLLIGSDDVDTLKTALADELADLGDAASGVYRLGYALLPDEARH